ncbi:MAG: hypothetical protein ACRD3O_09775, partial [Terriglobia bacterium]
AVDSVAKHMLSHRVTNAVVMEREAPAKPFGIVRSADLLRLQRHLRQRHLFSPVAPAERKGRKP